jgi:hypothetical protein
MQLVADQGTALQCLETVGVHQQHGLTVDTRLRVLPQLQPRLPSHTLVGISGLETKGGTKGLAVSEPRGDLGRLLRGAAYCDGHHPRV